MTAERLILLSGSLSSILLSRCLNESLTCISAGKTRGALQISSYRPKMELDLKGTVPACQMDLKGQNPLNIVSGWLYLALGIPVQMQKIL